jgi:hypothetical protein
MGSLAISPRRCENRAVESKPQTFGRDAIVVVTLRDPREKYWGAMLEITSAGLGMNGIDLNSFDDFVRLVRDGEPVIPNVVFFPIHRVERIELDLASGGIPSLQQRFAGACGQAASTMFTSKPLQQGR